MAKKLDFKQFKKPEQSILVQMESEKKQALKKQIESDSPKNKSKSVTAKSATGRPKIGDEIITKRFSMGFTAKEYKSLTDQANRVPLAVFIRDILKDAKVL